mmetsp:Transcript_5121/g.14546  ORF Transcript_5121/g.14546 Transcript_5121/m.14546 type:complete len:116 (-) Transcript_5121:34-381(-)
MAWLWLSRTAGSMERTGADGFVLEERLKLLRILPLVIQWRGSATGDTINWTGSSIRVGWRWLNKTKENPAKAVEKMQYPWRIRHAPGSDRVLFFHCEGIGNLVYVREDEASRGGG